MEKKEYVKPSTLVINVEMQGILATSANWIEVGDGYADENMEVLSKGRMSDFSEDDTSWGNLW